jgi:DNA-binding transcriptional MerR regulator
MTTERHISETARALGVSAGYLRLLEARGKIPLARRDHFGGRVYSSFDIALLQAMGVGSHRRLKRPTDVLGGVRDEE